MKKKLAIISANEEQVPLVNKAKEMGIETHCFAWDKDESYYVCKQYADYYHPISIMDKEAILEKCKQIQIDGVTSICRDIPVPTVAYVAQGMGLTGNRYEDTLIMRNKYKARQAMLKNGVNSPLFAVTSEGQNLDLTGFKYPLIVKPIDRCGSVGVMKADTKEDLKKALLRAQQLSYSEQVIVEEFVSGIELSAHTMSWNGKHYILAIRDKVTSEAPYFVEIAHHIPTQFSPEIVVRIENEVQKALDALNIKYGACDAEFKVNEEGNVFVIEINPRMGGDQSYDMIEYSTGLDYLKIAINVALGYWEEPNIVYHYYTGIHYWCEGQEWVKQVIDNKDKYPEVVKTLITKDVLNPLQCSGDRSGYFIYKSDNKKTRKDFYNS